MSDKDDKPRFEVVIEDKKNKTKETQYYYAEDISAFVLEKIRKSA